MRVKTGASPDRRQPRPHPMPEPDQRSGAEAASATPADTPAPDRRLHPLSWLFVLLQQLKQFLVPIVVLVLFGRGGRAGGFDNELWGLVAVGVLALVSVWRYFTYRYRIGADSLVVRSGVFERSLRQIPFARIHNVALHQSLLHRLFGVAEVRLESAGGQKPEAEMRVLRLADAQALEALIQGHAQRHAHAGTTAPGEEATAAGETRTLLALPVGEVLRHGLISNRGMLVVGAGFAAITQVSPDLLGDLVEGWGRAMLASLDLRHYGPAQYAVGALGLLLGFVAVLQALSVVLSLLQYHGFRLTETGSRLTMERGLLTRLRSSAPRRRIQAWTLREGLPHRLWRRRALQVDTAASRQQSEQRAFRELAPIATPDACDGLVRHLLPGTDWPLQDWQPLHPRAWWRMAIPGALVAALLVAVLSWHWGTWGLLGLAWLPWAALVARRNAQRAGYHVDDVLVAVREGWWSRHWRFAELDKLQVLRLRQGPLDRRLGMASLWLDTAGAGAFAPPLRIRFLPLADAQALHARLGREIARRPLRW